MASTNSESIEFDLSQFDESFISEEQKQNFIDFVNEIQRQKRTIEDELNQLKLSSGILVVCFAFALCVFLI